MKQIILLCILFTFAAVTFAQPTNPRFDADLKRLNQRFEKVESIKRAKVDGNTEIRIKRSIESAERELERFKKKYPDYDVAKYNRALNGYKNPTATTGISNSSASKTSSAEVSDFAKVENFVETIEEILKFNVDASSFIRDVDGTLDKTKIQLSNFQSKMNNALTSDYVKLAKDRSNRKIKRISDKAGRDAKLIETRLAKINTNEILKETKQNMMLLKYFRVLFMQEKLNQLVKVFGDNTDINKAKKSADTLIAQLGSIENIEQQGKKNYAEKVAKHRMFGNRQTNPALRKQAVRAFNSSVYRSKVKGNTVLKVHLVSNGWSVTRNKITGIILKRDQQAQIAYKAADGKCYTYLMLIEQKHLGGGRYGGAYDRSGNTQEILCSNIPK